MLELLERSNEHRMVLSTEAKITFTWHPYKISVILWQFGGNDLERSIKGTWHLVPDGGGSDSLLSAQSLAINGSRRIKD